MKDKINKELISNIEISESMKKTIYRNCLKGKSTADFRFKYSGLLSVLIIFGVFGVFSIGASATILGVKNRLENMDEAEYEGYRQEVENDVFVCIDEGFSRSLTDSEILRSIDLEREYYDKGVFPEKSLPHYNEKSEMKDGELAYVAADNLVYLPEGEMDDEQLLEYIDHDAKKRYVNIQGLKEEGIEPGVNMALESTPIEPGSEAAKVRELSDKYLLDYYGVSLDDSWIVLTGSFENEELPNGEVFTLYNIEYYRLGLGYANSYTFRFNANNMTPILISENGYKDYGGAKTYSFDEAKKTAEENEDYVKEFIKDTFGLENPDSCEYDVEIYSEDGKTTSVIDYELTYGLDSAFLVYRIEDKRITTYGRW